MDMSNFVPITSDEIRKQHSKTLYRSICVPSTTQSYSLCIEYMKSWFLSKFAPDTFKSIYVEGKNIYDDTRKLTREQMLKRAKPSLTIVPSIDWDFTNENIDSYPYGMDLYTQTGRFKNSFFACHERHSYMGIGMETLLMPFTFRVRLETRSQQLDMFKFMKLACRVGFTCGEDVDLDFHIPYDLMLQLAKDNGFDVQETGLGKDYAGRPEIIKNVPAFLRWLNLHSTIPFLYKYRALNGNNEFFIRMRNMYVHVRPSNISADDGEREGKLTNNFGIELQCEVRFPAPKMYAYYSDNAHKLDTIYGVWYQPNGPISTCYTFKGTEIPDTNKYHWPLYLKTTYEEDESKLNQPLEVEFAPLLEKDVGDCIKQCLEEGVSPAIFCDVVFYNCAEYVAGKMDWENLKFTSYNPVRNIGTFIGIYVDKAYLNNYIMQKNDSMSNRLQPAEKDIRTGKKN